MICLQVMYDFNAINYDMNKYDSDSEDKVKSAACVMWCTVTSHNLDMLRFERDSEIGNVFIVNI